MLFQTLVEVQRAHYGISDGKYHEDECDDRETGQVFPDRQIGVAIRRLIHPDKLEYEVSSAAEVQDDCNNHAKQVFSSSWPCCCEQNQDGDGNSGNGEHSLASIDLVNDDQELNREPEEEEKVKFQEGNIDLEELMKAPVVPRGVAYLVGQEAALHA